MEGKEKCCEVAKRIVDLTGYGQALHVNDILPDLRELLSNRENEIAEEVMKRRDKKKKYDGDSLETARNYYCIAAKDWTEIIRLEDGMSRAYDDVLSILKH